MPAALARSIAFARIASTVAGVGGVDNELRVMAVNRRFTYSKT